MPDTLALGVVLVAAVYLVALAGVALLRPAHAARFLEGFARSAATHYLELALRLVVGSALILQAPRMAFSAAFAAFGWVLIFTTAGLALVPWNWHRRFAERAVASAVRHLTLVGVASLALGTVTVVAVIVGAAR